MLKIAALATAAAAIVAFAAPARADVTPDSPAGIVVGHFEFTIEFPSDTNTCGFSVDEVVEVRGSFRFFDTAGSQPFANLLYENVTISFTANGKTVLATEHVTDYFPANAPELVEHGLSLQIKLLGGALVIQDAGTFVRTFDGTVTFVRGPHPLLITGGGDELAPAAEAICAALAP